MNWRNTICGLVLVGATAFLGCDEKPKDVEEKLKVEEKVEQKGVPEKLGMLEYEIDGRNFTLKAKARSGYVKLAHETNDEDCFDTFDLYVGSFLPMSHSMSIKSDCKGNILDYMKDDKRSFYRCSEIHSSISTCPEDVTEEAKAEMEKWKRAIATVGKLKHEVEYFEDFCGKFGFEIEAETPRGFIELNHYVCPEWDELKFHFDQFVLIEIYHYKSKNEIRTIQNGKHGKCYNVKLEDKAKCPEDQLEEAAEIYEQHRYMLDYYIYIEEAKRKQEELEKERNKPKNYLEGIK